MISHDLHQITAATTGGTHDRGLKFGVGVHEFIACLVEREERRSEATPPVKHGVRADSVKETDARHLLVRVHFHHRRHETIRDVTVSSGVHLPLHIRVGDVAVDDLSALLRKLPGTVTDRLGRCTVERR